METHEVQLVNELRQELKNKETEILGNYSKVRELEFELRSESSKEIGELATALAKAQAEFDVAKPDATNYYGSPYSTLGALLKATRPGLTKNQIALVQIPLIKDNKVGNTTKLVHSSGQYIRCTLVLNVTKQDAHAHGSALTYSKRYCVSALTGVISADDFEDDDGNGAVGLVGKDAKKPKQKVAEKKGAAKNNPPPNAESTKTKVSSPTPLELSEAEQYADQSAVLESLSEETKQIMRKAGYDTVKKGYAIYVECEKSEELIVKKLSGEKNG